MSHLLWAFTMVLLGYLAGSVPWGVVLTRAFAPQVDLRGSGSGNIGATNVRRTAGWQLGLATLAADTAKGALPVLIAKWIPLGESAVALVAAAAFLGHLYPLYSGLKGGGKGVATLGGCLMVLSPLTLAVCLGGFLVVAATFRRVSAASLTAVTLMPLGIWGFDASVPLTLWAVAVMALVWYRHRSNIHRMLQGTEPRI